MITEIVNLRKCLDWGDERDVYVGRAGRGLDGIFGNRIVRGQRCSVCGLTHSTPGATLACYEIDLDFRLVTSPPFRSRVRDLHRRRLGCFCAPRPCHATLLARRAEALACAPWLLPCWCARGHVTQCRTCFVGDARRCECDMCALRRRLEAP